MTRTLAAWIARALCAPPNRIAPCRDAFGFLARLVRSDDERAVDVMFRAIEHEPALSHHRPEDTKGSVPLAALAALSPRHLFEDTVDAAEPPDRLSVRALRSRSARLLEHLGPVREEDAIGFEERANARADLRIDHALVADGAGHERLVVGTERVGRLRRHHGPRALLAAG